MLRAVVLGLAAAVVVDGLSSVHSPKDSHHHDHDHAAKSKPPERRDLPAFPRLQTTAASQEKTEEEKAAACLLHDRRGQLVKQRLKADETGMAYYGTVRVGGQILTAVYDTGSWDNVILSSCKFGLASHHEKCCHQQTCPFAAYSTAGSSCYGKDKGEIEKLIFGSGTTWVQNAHDTVSIPPIEPNEPSLDIPKFPMKVVVDSNMQLFTVAEHLQAIFGIGMEAMKPGNPLDTMGVKRFMMCYDVNPLKDGVIYWNDQDRSQQSEWKSIDVLGDGVDWWSGFWLTTTGDWQLRGTQTASTGLFHTNTNLGCPNSNCAAILDSGTTLMTAPAELVEHLERAISKIEDCSNLSKFPTVTFKLGDQTFTLPPEAYVAEAKGTYNLDAKHELLALPMLPLTAEDRALHLQAQAEGGSVMVKACAILFEAEQHPEKTPWGPLVIIGMPMLRKYAVHFDTTNKPAKMRIAEADAHCEHYGPLNKQFKFMTHTGNMTQEIVHEDRWTPSRKAGRDQIKLPTFDPDQIKFHSMKHRKKYAKHKFAKLKAMQMADEIANLRSSKQ